MIPPEDVYRCVLTLLTSERFRQDIRRLLRLDDKTNPGESVRAVAFPSPRLVLCTGPEECRDCNKNEKITHLQDFDT